MSRVPAAGASAQLREKGSRFIAYLERVESEAEADALLDRLRSRHPRATHHCWARRLGEPPRERSSDAGEPAGTAGVPMLQVLRGAELTDVSVVVVRWFGGTKLGKGGLARAYAGAVREAVAHLVTEERIATRDLLVEVAYDRVGALRRLIHPPELAVLSEEYGDRATFRLRVIEERVGPLREALAEIGGAARDLEESETGTLGG